MKSIKPGRGPSGISFVGSVIAIIFGVFWTIMAAGFTAGMPGGFGGFFPLFGVLFIIGGIVQAVYNFKNAIGKDRFSVYDITDSSEERDPAEKWIKRQNDSGTENVHRDPGNVKANFCPYCGTGLQAGYKFCPKCGQELK